MYKKHELYAGWKKRKRNLGSSEEMFSIPLESTPRLAGGIPVQIKRKHKRKFSLFYDNAQIFHCLTQSYSLLEK
jgi:hypothetical protein